MLTRQTSAAVSVGTYWPWETTATLWSATQGASAPTEGGEGRGISWRPPAYSLFFESIDTCADYNCSIVTLLRLLVVACDFSPAPLLLQGSCNEIVATFLCLFGSELPL